MLRMHARKTVREYVVHYKNIVDATMRNYPEKTLTSEIRKWYNELGPQKFENPVIRITLPANEEWEHTIKSENTA